MTDDLKTVLVDALNAASETGIEASLVNDQIVSVDRSGDRYWSESYDADRLATAIRDHFLDREKVRAALEDAFGGPGGDGDMLAECRAEWVVDAVIAGLAGGSSE